MLPPRRFRSLSTGLLALFAAVPVVLPESAAAASCAPMAYAAESSADLVRLTALDLRPLGVPVGPVAELALASSRSTMDARKPVAARAAARYTEAGVVGLELSPLFLGSAVSQQAPPTHAGPAVYNALSQDAGVAKVGTGALSAHATWVDRMACGRQTGPAGVSSAAVADVSVLPSSSSAVVRLPRNLSSQAVTGLRTVGGRTASVAAAEVELTDLRLLNGAVAVKVLKRPTLTATATGAARTSSVEYSNPLLEISGPGVPTQRLNTPAKHVDVVLPATGGDPLGTLLRGLNVPLLNSLVGSVHVEGLQVPGPGKYAMLRISLGALDKSITDAAVEAEAASLRIQLILCGPDQAQVTVLDLAVGLLRTSATAPNVPVVSSPTPSTSPSAATSVSPAPSTSPAGCGGPGCGGPGTLPQTGMGPVAYVVGAGVLLALLGRLMILLARRRSV
ncbi:hypothetical protein HDA40_004851 [Hamadaea flava]|uniref:LPXTG-motif cell wall-anchored protein n=1 Tax=Hamadaea flava TaxID=1742688 RepID=A0ABV8LH99_9ACTN|nr:hypothetical protein [Hamadaea flava]MCP2326344.1 hypothetical protein [Hamadaea flava]